MTSRFAPYREASAGVQMILVSVHESCAQSRPPTVTFAVVVSVDGRKLSPLMVMLIPLVVALHLSRWYTLSLSLVQSEESVGRISLTKGMVVSREQLRLLGVVWPSVKEQM